MCVCARASADLKPSCKVQWKREDDKGMDRPGVRQVTQNSGELEKMEKTSVVPQPPSRLRNWWRWWWWWWWGPPTIVIPCLAQLPTASFVQQSSKHVLPNLPLSYDNAVIRTRVAQLFTGHSIMWPSMLVLHNLAFTVSSFLVVVSQHMA